MAYNQCWSTQVNIKLIRNHACIWFSGSWAPTDHNRIKQHNFPSELKNKHTCFKSHPNFYLKKISTAEFLCCFLCWQPEHIIEQTVEWLMTINALTLTWCHSIESWAWFTLYVIRSSRYQWINPGGLCVNVSCGSWQTRNETTTTKDRTKPCILLKYCMQISSWTSLQM